MFDISSMLLTIKIMLVAQFEWGDAFDSWTRSCEWALLNTKYPLEPQCNTEDKYSSKDSSSTISLNVEIFQIR